MPRVEKRQIATTDRDASPTRKASLKPLERVVRLPVRAAEMEWKVYEAELRRLLPRLEEEDARLRKQLEIEVAQAAPLDVRKQLIYLLEIEINERRLDSTKRKLARMSGAIQKRLDAIDFDPLPTIEAKESDYVLLGQKQCGCVTTTKSKEFFCKAHTC